MRPDRSPGAREPVRSPTEAYQPFGPHHAAAVDEHFAYSVQDLEQLFQMQQAALA